MQDELSVDLILQGYTQGCFPMADPDGEIYWYSPDPRTVFTYADFRIPRSLRPVLNRGAFEMRLNTRFEQVMRSCGDRPEGTWISERLLTVYCEMHRLGLAHSVESWQDGRLAGGLYGVALGGAFFGESMFHRVTDASKVALVFLMKHLKKRGFTLIDTQWTTPHLARFGAREIPRATYLRQLAEALQVRARFA